MTSWGLLIHLADLIYWLFCIYKIEVFQIPPSKREFQNSTVSCLWQAHCDLQYRSMLFSIALLSWHILQKYINQSWCWTRFCRRKRRREGTVLFIFSAIHFCRVLCVFILWKLWNLNFRCFIYTCFRFLFLALILLSGFNSVVVHVHYVSFCLYGVGIFCRFWIIPPRYFLSSYWGCCD